MFINGFCPGPLLSASRYTAWWVVCLFVISCTPKEFDMDYSQATDPAILKYFDRFETEAMKYGLEIRLETKGVYGVFSNLDNNKLGNCRYREGEPRKVSIDREYWQNTSDLDREYIVFHELGHCYLERGHDNSSDSGGYCRSIMHSAENKCILKYNANTRNAYLKELFSF